MLNTPFINQALSVFDRSVPRLMRTSETLQLLMVHDYHTLTSQDFHKRYNVDFLVDALENGLFNSDSFSFFLRTCRSFKKLSGEDILKCPKITPALIAKVANIISSDSLRLLHTENDHLISPSLIAQLLYSQRFNINNKLYQILAEKHIPRLPKDDITLLLTAAAGLRGSLEMVHRLSPKNITPGFLLATLENTNYSIPYLSITFCRELSEYALWDYFAGHIGLETLEIIAESYPECLDESFFMSMYLLSDIQHFKLIEIFHKNSKLFYNNSTIFDLLANNALNNAQALQLTRELKGIIILNHQDNLQEHSSSNQRRTQTFPSDDLTIELMAIGRMAVLEELHDIFGIASPPQTLKSLSKISVQTTVVHGSDSELSLTNSDIDLRDKTLHTQLSTIEEETSESSPKMKILYTPRSKGNVENSSSSHMARSSEIFGSEKFTSSAESEELASQEAPNKLLINTSSGSDDDMEDSRTFNSANIIIHRKPSTIRIGEEGVPNMREIQVTFILSALYATPYPFKFAAFCPDWKFLLNDVSCNQVSRSAHLEIANVCFAKLLSQNDEELSNHFGKSDIPFAQVFVNLATSNHAFFRELGALFFFHSNVDIYKYHQDGMRECEKQNLPKITDFIHSILQKYLYAHELYRQEAGSYFKKDLLDQNVVRSLVNSVKACTFSTISKTTALFAWHILQTKPSAYWLGEHIKVMPTQHELLEIANNVIKELDYQRGSSSSHLK